MILSESTLRVLFELEILFYFREIVILLRIGGLLGSVFVGLLEKTDGEWVVLENFGSRILTILEI